MKKIFTTIVVLFLFSCSHGQKTNNEVVENFEIDKYLGVWYEIARLDHSFERGCSNVFATYSKKENGDIEVVNTCTRNGEKDSAEARAHFKNDESNKGHLRVSFFWPFYGDYKIIYLNRNYQIALIDGGSSEYFWILSRQKTIPNHIMSKLLKKAEAAGFDTSKLIFTKHN